MCRRMLKYCLSAGAALVFWLGASAPLFAKNGTEAHGSIPEAVADFPARRTDHWQRSVYVWDSAALLDPLRHEEQVRALSQAGFNHVHVGFDATQVRRLGQQKGQVIKALEGLKRQGFTVGLLLGDPDWMLPEHRDGLLQLIDHFAGLPFDELHLDLEVEQLGWPVPEQRLRQWLQTLGEISARSPWPVTLVCHHRWFAPSRRDAAVCVPCELPGLGIHRVTAMLYSRAEKSVVQRTTAMLEAWPELEFQLAQSVEQELAHENSWHGATAMELKQFDEYLQTKLRPRGLSGVAWQDWKQYPRGSRGNRESKP